MYYAGDITRPGSNSEFQLIDQRIVGSTPVTLSHAEAAALPLTTITAYESLFDRLAIDREGADAGKAYSSLVPRWRRLNRYSAR